MAILWDDIVRDGLATDISDTIEITESIKLGCEPGQGYLVASPLIAKAVHQKPVTMDKNNLKMAF